MSSCAINCQLVPTPEIACDRGRGEAAQVFPAVQKVIADENFTPLQDENNETFVNET